MEELNKKQKQAYKLFLKNESFFISGPGGTGKSYLIQKFKEHYIKDLIKGRKIPPIAITAMTGAAALQINGQTLHSWAGIYDGSLTVEQLIKKIEKNGYQCKKWKETECLIIDEVSMLTAELFDTLNKIAKKIRDSTDPMGGLQTILVGDFFQLPPVVENKENLKFCFESKDWGSLIKKNIILDEIIRQESTEFQQMLNEIRVGKCSTETEEIIKRIRKKTKNINFEEFEIRPTEFYSTNKKVDEVNKELQKKLNKNIIKYTAKIEEEDYVKAIVDDKMYENIWQLFISEEEYVEEVRDRQKNGQKEKIEELVCKMITELKIQEKEDTKDQYCKQQLYDKQKKNVSQLPDTLELCVQSQVMLTKNLDTKKGLINGSRGVIVEFKKSEKTVNAEIPVVKFLNGQQIPIEYNEIYQYDHSKRISMKKKQIPLKLAWAMSQHKCQGATLDTAIIDIGKQIFTSGQSYVALSRCSSLDGLYIKSFSKQKIKADEKVVEFYEKLEQYEEKSSTTSEQDLDERSDEEHEELDEE